MKVTLVSPPSPFLIDQKAFPPLGILYVAAYLREQGLEVEVLDLANKEDCLDEALANHDLEVCGISATTPQYPYALKVKDVVKRRNPKSIVFVGGAHASSLPQKCLNDGFDAVVAGEGEMAALDIAKRRPIDQVVRFGYIKDIDAIPYPARDLIDIRDYGYDINGRKATTIITSRGCPYTCAFCSKDVWQRGVRYHGVNYTIDEIRQITGQYGFKHFLFLDDTLTLNKRRLVRLCDLLEGLDIRWRCYARSDTTSRDMLVRMKEAGCVEVGVGIESGSQKILDVVGKKMTVEQNTNFVQNCKEIGLSVNAFLMIGLPGETYETVMETRTWFEKARPDRFGFNIFAPYVGTPIYNHLSEYDIKIYDMPDEDSWVKGRQGEYQAFVSTSGLSRTQILKLFYELFEYFGRLTEWRPGRGGKEVTVTDEAFRIGGDDFG